MKDRQQPLPPKWAWTTLGTVAEVRLGKMLSPKAYEEGLTQRPYLRNENVRWGHIDFTDVKLMGFKSDEIARYQVNDGDLLVCEGGEPGRAAVFSGKSGQYMYQKALHRVRPRCNVVDTKFLQLFFQHGAGQAPTSQTTIAHLPLEKMLALALPLPPRAEQERIVSEAERQFTRLDAGVAALKRVQAQLKRYRASVLKAACEGRLVPTEAELARREKRDYEPADKLLARILKERRARWEADQLAKMKAAGKAPKDDKWKAKYVEPVLPPADLRAELPEGWSWTTVDSLLVEPPMNGLSVKESASPTEVRALRLSAMSNSGFDYSDYRFLPTHWSEVDDLEIREGDFFVSRGNGSLHLVGRGTVANNPPSRFIFPDTMIRLRLASPLSQSGWLSAIWSSLLIRRQIETSVKTTAGIFKISQPELARIVVPLPPFEEQIRAVHAIRAHLSIAEAGEDSVTASALRAARLRQAVLKTAFEGSLVPQDPNDEPASKLLERISAAVENKPLPKQGRARQATAVPKMKKATR